MAALMRLDTTTPLLTRRGDEVTRLLARALGDARAGQRSSWTPALPKDVKADEITASLHGRRARGPRAEGRARHATPDPGRDRRVA